MVKHTTTILGFTLATLLAGPALAQDNPSLEGYDGGHIQAETAFQTVDTPAGSAAYSASRLADNPSLEGYSGPGSPSGAPQYATRSAARTQFADNAAGIRTDSPNTPLKKSEDDFAWIEEKRTYGR